MSGEHFYIGCDGIFSNKPGRIGNELIKLWSINVSCLTCLHKSLLQRREVETFHYETGYLKYKKKNSTSLFSVVTWCCYTKKIQCISRALQKTVITKYVF